MVDTFVNPVLQSAQIQYATALHLVQEQEDQKNNMGGYTAKVY